MDLHQLWTIVSLPDNVPIVLLMIVVPFYTLVRDAAGVRQRPADRGARSQSGARQDAPSQDAALEARLGQGSARLAVPAAHRVSGRHHRHVAS